MSELSEISLPLLLLIGAATGTMTGLTGASGMSVLITVLLAFGIPADQIIASTFAVAGLNALFGVVPFFKHHRPTRNDLLYFILPASVGAVVSYLAIASHLGSDSLGLALTVLMLFAGFYLAVDSGRKAETRIVLPPLAGSLFALAGGGVIGIFGGGGTVFMMLGLIILFGVPYHRALMLSLLMTIATCVPLLLAASARGSVPWSPLLVILIVSLPAALFAGRWANRVDERYIKRGLGVYLVLISLALLTGRI